MNFTCAKLLSTGYGKKMLMMLMMAINEALYIAHPLNPHKDSE